MDNILTTCVKSFEPMARQSGVEITLRVADNLPTLSADDRSINQIVLNLLSNAVKFTGYGGTVMISAQPSEDNLVITISDTGVGIPTEMLPHLCEPFTRFNDKPHTAKIGTGLGLSIVKALVDIHAGVLAFESAVGVGTTVTVTLPLNAGG